LIPLAIILAAIAVFAAFFVGAWRKRQARARAHALLVSGRPAPALIVQARDGSASGVQGGRTYRKEIRLVLEVRPPDRQPFRANATVYDASPSDAVRPGQTLLVKYDPADTSLVAVDGDSFRQVSDDVAMEAVLAAERGEEASRATLAQLDGRPKTR
jgi:hypothetical protein